uniref:Uncharacterized protein n=1 Tax=Timema monikensis TaxID=170555 RepID=A0A7R9HP45_9NEOP|nr:unnamed protein product [Timema monikensis]
MALADQWGPWGPGIAIPGPHWSCPGANQELDHGHLHSYARLVGGYIPIHAGKSGDQTTVRRTRTTRNVARRGRGRKKTAVNPPRSTRSKRSKKGDSDDDDDDVQEIETQAASDVENSDTVEQEVSNTDGEDLASPEEEINETNPVKNGLQEVEFVENTLVSKDTHNTKKDAEEESLEDSNEEDVDKVIVEIINPDDVKPTDSDKDRSLIQTSSDLANRESVESCSEDEQTEAVVVTQVPELEEAPPPSVNKLLPSPSIVSNLRQKSVEADINQTNTSHDSGDEGQSDGHCQNKQEEEEEVGNANMDDMTVIDEVMEEGDEKDDSGATAKSELKKEGEMELDTELVSDEELPDPATAADLPETEAVSEDELPPEKTDKKKKTASKSSDNKVEGMVWESDKSVPGLALNLGPPAQKSDTLLLDDQVTWINVNLMRESGPELSFQPLLLH